MKVIHSFAVKDASGKDVKFDLVSPSRAVAKECELVYAKTYGASVRAGLLTNAEAIKISAERGGVLTKEEEVEYSQLLSEYFAKEQALNASRDKKADEPVSSEEQPTEEGKKRKKTKIATEEELAVKALKEKILAYQAKQDSILAHTAESRSRDESVFFNVLFLTYKDGKPFFDGKNFDDKVAKFESAAQSDEFLQKVFRKASWFCSAIAYGISNLKDFAPPEDEGDDE